jgi:hypothetical protein
LENTIKVAVSIVEADDSNMIDVGDIKIALKQPVNAPVPSSGPVPNEAD